LFILPVEEFGQGLTGQPGHRKAAPQSDARKPSVLVIVDA
jgi:hypothetical protein